MGGLGCGGVGGGGRALRRGLNRTALHSVLGMECVMQHTIIVPILAVSWVAGV